MDVSPSSAIKNVEAQVRLLLRPLDERKMATRPKKAVDDLRQVLTDARIYALDYELSEMRDEQLDNARQARHWLNEARKDILTASEFDIFGAVDVAQLTAQIDDIIAKLK